MHLNYNYAMPGRMAKALSPTYNSIEGRSAERRR